MTRKRLCAPRWATLCLLALVVGCARSGVRLEHRQVGPGVPKVKAILADLASNDAAIETFSARGTLKVALPDMKARKKFRATTKYRRPADFMMDLRHYGTFAKVLHLICSGDRVIAESRFAKPDEDESLKALLTEYLGQDAGEADFEDTGTGDAVREVFFPEDWSRVKPRRVRVTEHETNPDTGASTAVLEFATRKDFRRRITVEGSPWVLRASELIDERGVTLVQVKRSDYQTFDGIRFPKNIDVEFPEEKAHLVFDLKNVDLNCEIEAQVFVIKEAG
jgi:outer membrane lipoprotein-sorting protein